jgi:hypothetical protein
VDSFVEAPGEPPPPLPPSKPRVPSIRAKERERESQVF